MNVMPSKVGADPKKIAILAGLVAVAGYFYFYNSNSSEGSGSAPVASRDPGGRFFAAAAPGSTARSTYRDSAAIGQQALGNSGRP